MGVRKLIVSGISGLAVVVGLTAATANSEPTSAHLTFTAAGDYAQRTGATDEVLKALATESPDLHLALGDLSYGTVGGESAWCDFVKSHVGEKFPFELLSGNHESNGQNGNINDFSACLPNQLPGIVGTYGREYYVDVPQQAPLVRYVMISPDLTYPDGTWDYHAGGPRQRWLSAAIDGARTDGIPWVVVGMHKTCLTTGGYSCEIGTDLANLLISKRVDLVLTGHEHSYQRTKQLTLGAACPTLMVDGYDSDCVADPDDDMVAGSGTVFLTAGTGGVAQRDLDPADPEAPYFAALGGSSTAPTYGFGAFDVTPERIAVRFVRAAGGALSDSFTLTKGDPGLPMPNQAPLALFSATSNGLTASFDGSGSSDFDGTIAGWSWDFGDGSTGTGATPKHAYSNAGTYDVTLTVTDDDGATGTVTWPVTVTAPTGPRVLASDAFQRALTNGWGTADSGGTWTTPTTGSSVSGGRGHLLVRAGGNPTAVLGGTSSTTVDLRAQLTLDKVPAGTAYPHVVLRRAGAGSYLAYLRVLSTGAVRASLARQLNGSDTLLTSEYVVPGGLVPGGMINVRGRVTGAAPTTLQLKIWKDGTPEPATWTLTATDSTAGLQSAGGVGFAPYLSRSVTNGPIQVSFDNLLVEDVP